MLTLYQAEWCPYSAAVRERLTELGLDVLLRPVPPYREQREELRRVAGDDSIPVLVDEEGRAHAGLEAILAHLATLPGGEHERAHRQRYGEHRDERERELTAALLRRFAPLDDPG